MSSNFIEGMVQGTLDPDAFSAFELQDAVYLGKTRIILRETATTMTSSHPSFADMYNIQAGKYDQHYQALLSKKNMQEANSVVMGPVTKQYLEFLTQLSTKKDPRLLAFGVLPCSQSWRFISGQLIGKVDPKSEYKGWFEANLRQPDYESKLEKFINGQVEEGVFSRKKSKIESTYFEGMQSEENFIAHASDL